MRADPVSGTEFSGQSVYWKCFTSREDSSLVSTRLNSLIQPLHHPYTHREHSILPESIVRVWSGPNEYDLQVVVLACPTVGPVHVTLHLQTNDPTVTTVLLVIECLMVLKEMAN